MINLSVRQLIGPDTCCAGWQIMIDEDSLDRYGKEPGEFGKRLRNSIDWKEECFYQNQQPLCISK